MAVSPYALFMRKHAKNPALKGLAIAQRGKATAKLYKALPAAEKAALIKTAKATPAFKRTKVVSSVRSQARALGIPVALVKKQWYSTKGSSTQTRLRAIAAKAKITPRKVRA